MNSPAPETGVKPAATPRSKRRFRWLVKGTKHASGQAVWFFISVPEASEARAKAEARGIVVSDVMPATPFELERAGLGSRGAAVMLEYGDPPEQRMGYEIGLWLLGLVLLVGVVWLSIVLVPDIAEIVRHASVRRECENYVRPATQVVVESDVQAGRILQQSSPEYSTIMSWDIVGASGFTANIVGHVPACVSRLGYSPTQATAYLHRLSSDDGLQMLVLLEVSACFSPEGIRLTPTIFTPADLKDKASVSRVSSRRNTGGMLRRKP